MLSLGILEKMWTNYFWENVNKKNIGTEPDGTLNWIYPKEDDEQETNVEDMVKWSPMGGTSEEKPKWFWQCS